jgi:hypothetical protein
MLSEACLGFTFKRPPRHTISDKAFSSMRGSICVNSKGRAHEHERKGSSGKPSFRFVNAVPENEEERTNLRSVVRANATQYKLRLSRVARTGPAVAPTAAEQVHCNKGVAGHEHKAF